MISRRVVTAALFSLFLAPVPSSVASAPASATFTFFVASDTHFGAENMEVVNRALVEEMNALPGQDFPAEMGGKVEKPRGVLVTGDLTDNGTLEEFALFEKYFGRTGRDGMLRYPVFEAIGNHDVNATSPIKERARVRHGGINYSWSWEGVHFASLDQYPDAVTLAWLANDLRNVPPQQPIVLFFHYPLQGRDTSFWGEAQKTAFADFLAPYNVAALFHGHQHRDAFYEWCGYPVFRSGASRHAYHTFLVARMEHDRLTVAARDFDAKAWTWWTQVPIRR